MSINSDTKLWQTTEVHVAQREYESLIWLPTSNWPAIRDVSKWLALNIGPEHKALILHSSDSGWLRSVLERDRIIFLTILTIEMSISLNLAVYQGSVQIIHAYIIYIETELFQNIYDESKLQWYF